MVYNLAYTKILQTTATYMKITMSLHSNLAFRNLQCSCFGYYSKGCLYANPSFSLLGLGQKYLQNTNIIDVTIAIMSL